MDKAMMPLVVSGMVVAFFPMWYMSTVVYQKCTDRAMSDNQSTALGLLCVVIVVIGGAAATLIVGG